MSRAATPSIILILSVYHEQLYIFLLHCKLVLVLSVSSDVIRLDLLPKEHKTIIRPKCWGDITYWRDSYCISTAMAARFLVTSSKWYFWCISSPENKQRSVEKLLNLFSGEIVVDLMNQTGETALNCALSVATHSAARGLHHNNPFEWSYNQSCVNACVCVFLQGTPMDMFFAVNGSSEGRWFSGGVILSMK